jgi:hypothetical protein
MADRMRVVHEIGPRGTKVVAVAPDWPGLERGAATGEAATERLRSYLPRYAPVAELAGMTTEFAAASTSLDLVEQYPGTGSTDFWGISFAFSTIDREAVSDDELARELTLMRACWAFFDGVRSRVSANMRPGPRGGGRDRDRIVGHVIGTERGWAKMVGLPPPDCELPTDAGLEAHRDAYCAAIRAHHAAGKTAGRVARWPLRFLIRHTAFHALDHAWEMEDKDLTVGDLGG